MAHFKDISYSFSQLTQNLQTAARVVATVYHDHFLLCPIPQSWCQQNGTSLTEDKKCQ